MYVCTFVALVGLLFVSQIHLYTILTYICSLMCSYLSISSVARWWICKDQTKSTIVLKYRRFGFYCCPLVWCPWIGYVFYPNFSNGAPSVDHQQDLRLFAEFGSCNGADLHPFKGNGGWWWGRTSGKLQHQRQIFAGHEGLRGHCFEKVGGKFGRITALYT